MKLVILDGDTTIRGGLSWDCMKKFGELDYYEQTMPDELIDRCKDADAVFTNKVRIMGADMDKMPNLKYIGLLATGMDNIDVEGAKERGITVTNVPGYAEYSVSQMTFALILELCYSIREHVDLVMKEKTWSDMNYNTFWTRPLIGLEGRTLGVIGMGKIGRNVARIGQAFGMKIVAFDVYKTEMPDVEWKDMYEVIKEADFLSLNCPLTPETEKLINKETLATMKPTAFVINTARGGLIDESALIDALNSGRIAGAGLDVIMHEPPKKDDPILSAKNLIITPHIGWATVEARKKVISIVENNFAKWLEEKA